MKIFRLKYLFVFLFTISVFHLTGAECDEDNNTVTGINEAALGKWVSTTFPGETQYLYITTDSISVWIKEDSKPCYNLEFSSKYTGNATTLTISIPDQGSQNVSYSINSDTLTVIPPDGDGGKDTVDFTKTDFDPTTFLICSNLDGTWQNTMKPNEYLEIVDENYEIWLNSGSCYSLEEQDSYTFDQDTKTGTIQISGAVDGEGDITYNEGNNTITIIYTPIAQQASQQLEITQDETNTYSKVSDIDFYNNECLDD